MNPSLEELRESYFIALSKLTNEEDIRNFLPLSSSDSFEELKKDPKITSHMAKEEDLSPIDYITYTITPDKNISYYDSTLKKIYTLKNNQNKNH